MKTKVRSKSCNEENVFYTNSQRTQREILRTLREKME